MVEVVEGKKTREGVQGISGDEGLRRVMRVEGTARARSNNSSR